MSISVTLEHDLVSSWYVFLTSTVGGFFAVLFLLFVVFGVCVCVCKDGVVNLGGNTDT